MSTKKDAEIDYRQLLETEKSSLTLQLAEIGYGETGSTQLSYDSNFADSSQVTAEKSETEALVSELRSALADVNEALSRLDKGTYGICQGCGLAISSPRLEAIPTVKYCIDCASVHKKR
ncbi:MAG: TraR/DksA C4-type zinc finger protein [Firmicutes bacterium]|jgi:RNA polymerase-binding transcription factor DksA|nr:TraR/DksA C4-type zinc finger protein [Bacillota bacterium]